MKREFKRQIVDLLNEHRIMTIATNREDGWPQATVVSYGNDGLVIYCLIARDSQKYANIRRDPRVSLAIAKDYPQPLQIKGLSIAAPSKSPTKARSITSPKFSERYPEYKVMPRPTSACRPTIDAGNRLRARLFERLRAQRLLVGTTISPSSSKRAGTIGRLSRGLARIEPVRRLTGVPRMKSFRRYRLLAGALRLHEAHRAVATGDGERSSSGAMCHWPAKCRTQHLTRAIGLEPSAGNGDRPRMWSCTRRRLGPIDARLL